MANMKVLGFLLVLTIVPVISYKQQQAVTQICKNGYAHDKLFPDNRFTCKPGPGKYVKCFFFTQSLNRPIHCPKYGYVSGWHIVGKKITVKCCTEPGLYYSNKNCINVYNDDVINGRVFRVTKGKVITGFKTFDGGKTWINKECWYQSRPKFSYYNVKKMY